MAVPAYSAFSAVSELLVTGVVFHVVWRAWRHGDLRKALLVVVLAFEVLVNVTYMAYRMAVPSEGLASGPDWLGPFAAAHGILSLAMLLFLGLITAMAWRDHERGENFFREQPGVTLAFVVLWTASIVSGETLFVVAYL